MGGVGNCARCGGDHPAPTIKWEKLERPILDNESIEWTHWCPCPANGQPILMRNGTSAKLVTEMSVDVD